MCLSLGTNMGDTCRLGREDLPVGVIPPEELCMPAAWGRSLCRVGFPP